MDLAFHNQQWLTCQKRNQIHLFWNTYSVIYWPLTEPSFRDSPVLISGRRSRRRSGSKWALWKNIGRCQRQLDTGRPEWGPACRLKAGSLSDPRLSNPSQDAEEVLLRRKSCINIAVCPCLHSSLTHNRTIKNKVWDIYFYKEVCSFVHWSS